VQIAELESTGQLLSSTFKPWLFLKIETDAGISGWGEGSGEWLTLSVEATLHEWSSLLIDRDALPVVGLTEDITNRLPWEGGPVFGTAIAAINTALYDIAGKAWGVPVHTILGGKRRDRVRVYCSGNLFASPEKAVTAAQQVKAQGYAGVKGNPLETRTWPMDGAAIDHSVACVAAVREEATEGNALAHLNRLLIRSIVAWAPIKRRRRALHRRP
jgi:galactonate dehydratase